MVAHTSVIPTPKGQADEDEGGQSQPKLCSECKAS